VDGRLRDQVSLVSGGLRIDLYSCYVLPNPQHWYPSPSTTGQRQDKLDDAVATEQRVRLHSATCLWIQIPMRISTDYISNRRLLMSLADAGGRLMYAYKDLLELAGLTTRLYTLLSTLHHLKPLPEFVRSPESVEFKNVVVGIPRRDAELGEAPLVNTKTGGERGGGV
jgi:hypothetical protein